jgi:hypothetical protein
MTKCGGDCGRLLCKPCFETQIEPESYWRRAAIITAALLVSGVRFIVVDPQTTAGKLGRSGFGTSVQRRFRYGEEPARTQLIYVVPREC